ncbi:hypothetical protein MP228_006722 [Amoeboaphelidium protococcarum]|nr:hypothetical protein MP228_006722 [Amoeboaphelidium protococcarum]
MFRPPHHNVPVQSNWDVTDVKETNRMIVLLIPTVAIFFLLIVSTLATMLLLCYNVLLCEIKAYEIKAGDPPILDINEAWPLGSDKSFEVHVNPKLSSDKIALGSVKKLLAL